MRIFPRSDKMNSRALLAVLAALVCSATTASAQVDTAQSYHLLRIWLSEDLGLHDIEAAGIDIDHAEIKAASWIETILSEAALRRLRTMPLRIDVKQRDMEGWYAARLSKGSGATDELLSTGLRNFRFGSMGGYHRLQEAYDALRRMHRQYPDFVSKADTIGRSVEGRPILAYRVGPASGTHPELLITALHHAREPAGLSTVLYFLWYLLEQAEDGDAEANHLLRQRRLIVVPVINPDGYAFNERRNPGGGGLWRKNMRPLPDGATGVDLNRNYGPAESWNAPNFGSSTRSSDERFRGAEPFSEPETRAIRDLCRRYSFRLALNYHTFGNLYIYPHSYQDAETPDSLFFRAFTDEIAHDNGYAAGRDVEAVRYRVRGASDDWMYLDEELPQPILALTAEVGRIGDGFWPERARIVPLARESLSANLNAMWSAGANVLVERSYTLHDASAATARLGVDLRNIGAETSSQGSLLVRSLDPRLRVRDAELALAPLAAAAARNLQFDLDLDPDLPEGWRVPLQIEITIDGFLRSFSAEVQVSRPELIELSSASLVPWIPGNWGVVEDRITGAQVLTDSPSGNYPRNDDNYCRLAAPIDLRGALRASLEFEARWAVESNYDFAVVQASVDGGLSWQYLSTGAMKLASAASGSRQAQGSFGFDGIAHEWQLLESNLDAFVGKELSLRFGMLSDARGEFDGIYLRNIRVRVYRAAALGGGAETGFSLQPNPVGSETAVALALPPNTLLANAEVSVLNTLGQRVFFRRAHQLGIFKNQLLLPLATLGSGTYTVVLTAAGRQTSRRLVIVR